MYTQISCPNCGTPFQAEIHQIIDAKRSPELKQRLLQGSLNVAVCPSCGAGGQLSSILVFHDPDFEMFLIYIPQELHLSEVQREQMIGRLTQEVMNSLPAEERRAYMLQPQIILNMQTFMENVLETEGITKEMIERQKKQAELLNTLAQADKDVQDYLIKERSNEIDETFFAMLQQYIDSAAQIQNSKQMVDLTNLRARLMTQTAVGKQLEQRQIAVHKLGREAKKEGGLTPQMLANHVVANQEDEGIVDALMMAGQSAMQYEFFSELTTAIEKANKDGDKPSAQRLTYYREKYLEMYDQMQNASREILEGAMTTLNNLLNAPDKATAVQENIEQIDDAFMYILAARLAEAEQKGNTAEINALNEVQETIVNMVEAQLPPEVQFINNLMRAETTEEQEQLLAQNQHLITPELVQMIDQVIKQAEQQGQEDVGGRLLEIKEAIASRV